MYINSVPTPDSPRFSKLRPPISSDGRPSSATALYQQNEVNKVHLYFSKTCYYNFARSKK